MERINKITFVIILLLSLITPNLLAQNDSEEWINIIGNDCLYGNGNHAAFTSIQEWNGFLFVAFREANSHLVVPNEYGRIRVMIRENGEWKTHHVFSCPGLDMRDPCLVKLKGKLLLHSSGYYSELKENGWSSLKKINYEAGHSVYIWKIREYNDELYGIGNYYGYWPLLLKSSDGENWNAIKKLKIGGNATEADLLFNGKEMFICFRVESPEGSNSIWGRAKYPFEEFSLTQMDISIASPELFRHSRNVFLLSGREICYEQDKKVRQLSIFAINKEGKVLGRYVVDNKASDLGYPGIHKELNGLYKMSYYSGNVTQTKVQLLTFKVKNSKLKNKK